MPPGKLFGKPWGEQGTGSWSLLATLELLRVGDQYKLKSCAGAHAEESALETLSDFSLLNKD